MAFYKIHPIQTLNFPINRILSYGEEACKIDEIEALAGNIKNLDSWFSEWQRAAYKAEMEKRHLHAAGYFRLAGYFLDYGSPGKQKMYEKSVENYHKVILNDPQVQIIDVPFQNAMMKTIIFKAKNEKAKLIVIGGYDSFIEEYILTIKSFPANGYSVYLLEGPGQGNTLEQGVKFLPDWEKPVSALLNHFKIENAALLGISWGGYSALRACAFESRITHAAAYNILYDGFTSMARILPFPYQALLKILFRLKNKAGFNKIMDNVCQKKVLVENAIRKGKYITGTSNSFDFYDSISRHSLKSSLLSIKQHVLLLAGEKDHMVPLNQYYKLKTQLKNVKSVTARIFTSKEKGEHHLQTGSHMLAIDYILSWLDKRI